MSTSDKRLLKTALIYAWVSSFFAFFGAVYEVFSHQVYSYFMIYAFAIPLGMGVIRTAWSMSIRRQELSCLLRDWSCFVRERTKRSILIRRNCREFERLSRSAVQLQPTGSMIESRPKGRGGITMIPPL